MITRVWVGRPKQWSGVLPLSSFPPIMASPACYTSHQTLGHQTPDPRSPNTKPQVTKHQTLGHRAAKYFTSYQINPTVSPLVVTHKPVRLQTTGNPSFPHFPHFQYSVSCYPPIPHESLGDGTGKNKDCQIGQKVPALTRREFAKSPNKDCLIGQNI